uniref:Succinate dehydrogenase assembly factor 2, mitochondrial n=1 Tax=Strongyloides papillosus TaxID=174720 RepID=A0A0N5C8D0_STREA
MVLLNTIKTIGASFRIISKHNIHHTILKNAVSTDLKSKIIYKETDIQKQRARLYYQSKKRGILENDIIFGDFADEMLKSLSPKQLIEYDKLINGDTNEWDLFYYVTGRKEAPQEISKTSVFPIIKKFVSEKEGMNNCN